MYIALIISVVLLVGFLTYCMCAAAGREDERLEEDYDYIEESKKASEEYGFLHKHDYVKHYDQKREEYVMRCTKCDKVTDR